MPSTSYPDGFYVIYRRLSVYPYFSSLSLLHKLVSVIFLSEIQLDEANVTNHVKDLS
jgi:hypothetical protein